MTGLWKQIISRNMLFNNLIQQSTLHFFWQTWNHPRCEEINHLNLFKEQNARAHICLHQWPKDKSSNPNGYFLYALTNFIRDVEKQCEDSWLKIIILSQLITQRMFHKMSHSTSSWMQHVGYFLLRPFCTFSETLFFAWCIPLLTPSIPEPNSRYFMLIILMMNIFFKRYLNL